MKTTTVTPPRRAVLCFGRTGRQRHKALLLGAITLIALPVLADFRIIAITRNGPDMAITFEAEQGVTYSLQRRPNLTSSAWQNIPGVNDVTAPSNGPAQFRDPGAINFGQGFYRVSASKAIYVDALGGNDGNPGTRVSPKKTIAAGVAAAVATATSDVYVSKGTYNESVTLASGVNLYGSYDAANGWSRATTNTTTVASPAPIAMLGIGLNVATRVEMFDVIAGDASGNAPNGDGLSSYGVVILNSPGRVTLNAMSITAGNGTSGLAAAAGAAGLPGTNGGNAVGTARGAPGPSPCGANGGPGADASFSYPGLAGTGGIGVIGGGSGAPGGAAGAAGSCSSTSSSNGGSAPAVSTSGSPGFDGSGGIPNSTLGALDSSGFYSPSSGGAGTAGRPGGGGGGGGSGGGTGHGHSFFCTDCAQHPGGAGGGGGGGGCGGSGGAGGRGGGGSFAAVIVNSSVTINSSTLATRDGGTGGAGGDAGMGGEGGAGGSGAAGVLHSSSCSTRTGGNGASGSAGGRGGRGGGGAGGTGGPSICVFYKGAAPMVNASTFATGSVGQGGPGGQGAVRAASGAMGRSGTIVPSN